MQILRCSGRTGVSFVPHVCEYVQQRHVYFVELFRTSPVIDCRSFPTVCRRPSRPFVRSTIVAPPCSPRLAHPVPARSDHQASALGTPSWQPTSLPIGAASSAPNSCLHYSSRLLIFSVSFSACSLLWGLGNRRAFEGRLGRVSDVERRRRGMKP